eukprot:COSAG06_NODE_3579_length_5158_cov_66.302629_3_plen_48_part_00
MEKRNGCETAAPEAKLNLEELRRREQRVDGPGHTHMQLHATRRPVVC